MVEEFNNEYVGSMNEGYYMQGYRIGAPTSPQTANQVAEMGKLLNSGVQNVEVGSVNPEVFETIPDQLWDEMRRMGKMTGAQTSVHGPGIDLSGFTQQGWDEAHRVAAERQLVSVLDRAHKLDPEGNTPVTMHAGAANAQEWKKPSQEEVQRWTTELEKQGRSPEQIRNEIKQMERNVVGVVNQDTGQITMMRSEERRYFGGEMQLWTPERRLDSMNRTQWDQSKLQIQTFNKDISELKNIFRRNEDIIKGITKKERDGMELTEREQIERQDAVKEVSGIQPHIQTLRDNARSSFEDLYSNYEKYSDKKSLEYRHFNERLLPNLKKAYDQTQEKIMDVRKNYSSIINRLNSGDKSAWGEYEKISAEHEHLMSVQTEMLTKSMDGMKSPEMWKTMDEFAKEKASTTIANATFDAYKKYGDKTPLVCIENVYPEMPLSRADSLRDAIDESRKKFSDKLIKEKNMSKDEANKTAEKLIGATWDVGHINLLRKGGWDEKELIEETKKIAGKVKHVHITDNFGYGDTHLPPGMGNVPVKELMKELEKKGYSGRAIMEAGGFARFFETSPHPYILEGMGSPLYSSQPSPYWGNIQETYSQHYSGFGEILPKQHFDMYGAGFSTLPRELGGQAGGDRSRFAGTPNQ